MKTENVLLALAMLIIILMMAYGFTIPILQALYG